MHIRQTHTLPVKCTRSRLRSLSVLPLLSAHPQQLRELKLEFGQLCCKDDRKSTFVAVELGILQSLDKERIIDVFAKTSMELSKALL